MSLRLVRPGDDGSGYPKASLALRAGARLVDVAIAWGLFRATGPAGVIIAFLYVVFADGMLMGQSPGKKIFGVKVVFLPTRSGARHRDSVLRNAPFGLVLVLSMMPELGPKAFFAGLAVIGAIESLQCIRDPQGLRLGDVWAQTQVIDGRVQADQPQRSTTGETARAPARLRSSAQANRTPHEEL